MYDENVKNFVEPLIGTNWDRRDRNILDRLRDTFKDYLYFRCLSKIFPNYSNYIFLSLISGLNYKKYKPHEIVLNYNEEINKIYFIILGKLNIYKIFIPKIMLILTKLIQKNKNADKRKQILDYFNTYIKRYLKTISEKAIFLNKRNNKGRRVSFDNINNSKKKSQISELESFYRVIINQNKTYDYSLDEGKIFGEEYIYHDIKYSNCIIESDSECIVGELDKDLYEKLYKRINIIERSSITAFIVNLKIFNSSNFFLPKLQKCLVKRNFAKNEIIFKQNDTFRTFYVIRKGKVNLSLKIPKKVNCHLEPEIIMGNKKNNRFTSENAFVIKGNYSEKNEYNLMTVQDGEFLGEIEYYTKKDKYMYTAQCSEDDCILFEFDLFLFEHLIKNNKSINSNLKGFFEKIKEKINLLQERIYTMKRNGSAIKQSDYVLSKNKFTKNLLLNNPLIENANNNKENLNTSLNNKINKSDFIYFSSGFPLVKRNFSANRNKKFNKIQINNAFFNSRNIRKEEKKLICQSAPKSRLMSKQRNISSANISNNLSRLVFNKNKKLFLLKENINENNNCHLIINSHKNKTQKNLILNDYINKNFGKKLCKKENFSNNFNRRNISKKLKNMCITNCDTEKSFDFLDPNLDFTRNERNKNIPIIIKETKKSKRYKKMYDKEMIKKINSFYFNSPKNNMPFKELKKEEEKII